MMSSAHPTTRTLTIVLEEHDWRALRAAEPDAIGWLRERIRERIGEDPSEPTRSSALAGAAEPCRDR